MKVTNLKNRIDDNAQALDLSAAQVANAIAICDTFIAAVSVTDSCKQVMQGMKQWRDAVLDGEPVGTAAPQAPVFPVVGPVTYTLGVVKQLFKLRDMIVSLPGYTMAIGEDLGIVGAEITPPEPSEMAPVFKSVRTSGTTVTLTGSMHGMDAMRVEYAPANGSFSTVGFATNTPVVVNITPTNPNQPENGQIRAVFIKKNSPFGNFSANYPVTIS